jgi:hypothetical protein
MTAVWEHSPQKEGSLLILLALADFAHDDGAGAFPSIKTLAHKARMSERNAQYCLRRLEAAGEIEKQGFHTSGATIWRVVLPVQGGANIAGANIAPGAIDDTLGVQVMHRGGATSCTLTVNEPLGEPLDTPLPPKRGEYSQAFEQFWTKYPKVLNSSKKKAAQVWERMKPDKRAAAMAGLDKYLASEGWQRGFAPHTTTYLRGELWDSDPPAARMNGHGAPVDEGKLAEIDSRLAALSYQGVVEEIPRP